MPTGLRLRYRATPAYTEWMAIDNRDWYRKLFNKRSGYVERAAFRLGDGERAQQKHRDAWRRNWLIVFVAVCATVLLVVVKKALQ